MFCNYNFLYNSIVILFKYNIKLVKISVFFLLQEKLLIILFENY